MAGVGCFCDVVVVVDALGWNRMLCFLIELCLSTSPLADDSTGCSSINYRFVSHIMPIMDRSVQYSITAGTLIVKRYKLKLVYDA